MSFKCIDTPCKIQHKLQEVHQTVCWTVSSMPKRVFTCVTDASQVDYWRKQLEGIPSLLELPTSKMRPSEPSGRAFNVPFIMSRQLFSRIKSTATSLRASPLMIVIAAFQASSHTLPDCPDGSLLCELMIAVAALRASCIPLPHFVSCFSPVHH